MATLKPKLEINLGLNKSGLEKALRGVLKDLDGLDKRASRATGTLGKLRGAMTGVFKRGLGVAVGLGLFRLVQKIGGAFRQLGNEVLDFDEQMRNVNSIAQLSEKAFGRLTGAVLELAEDSRITDLPAKLAAGLYTLTSSGYSTADSMTILKVAAMGATAGLTSTDVATDVLASTLGAYGRTAKDATATMNELFQIVFVSKYTFEDLALSMATVTPAAAALGVSVLEVGAAMATMGKQGTDAQTATVQLNGVLTGLLEPTDAMIALLSEMGYSSGSAAIEALGFAKVLQILQTAIGGDAEKAAELFGDVRALRGILQLTTQDGALYAENLEMMGHAQDGAGATAKALTEQMKSARFQLRLLRKNVILFFTEGIGAPAAKKFAAFLALFNRFFSRMFKLRREFNNLKGFLLSFHIILHQLFGRKIGDAFFEVFREGIRIFRLFRDIVNGDWAKAWKQLQRIGRDGERFLHWLWGRIKAAFAAVDWVKFAKNVGEGLKLIGQFLGRKALKLGKLIVRAAPKAVGALWTLIKDAGLWIWKQIKKHWDGVLHLKKVSVKATLDLTGDLADMRDDLGEWIRKAIRWTVDKIVPMPKLTLQSDVNVADTSGKTGGDERGFLARFWEEFQKDYIAIHEALLRFFRQIFYIIGYAGGLLTVAIVGIFARIIYGIVKFFENPKEAIQAIATFSNKITEFLFDQGRDIASLVIASWSGFFTAVGDAIPRSIQLGMAAKASEVILWILQFGESIVRTFEGMYNALWNAGHYIMTGFWDGIKWVWDNVIVGGLHDIGDEISKHKGPESRDKKLLIPTGKLIMQGLMSGIEGELPKLYRSLEDTTRAISRMGQSSSFQASTMRGSVPLVTGTMGRDAAKGRATRPIIVNQTIHSNDGKRVASELIRFLDLVEAGRAP